MKHFFAVVFYILPYTLITGCTTAQTRLNIAHVDKDLAYFLERINYWDRDTSENRFDSLEAVNNKLGGYLKSVCLKYPETITAPFPLAEKNGLKIISSDDANVRFYCWNTETGGSMHIYSDYVQYKVPNGIKCECLSSDSVGMDYGDNMNYGTYYMDLTTIHTKDKKTLYLVHSIFVESSPDRAESIGAFIISGNELKNIEVFKTSVKSLAGISYEYDAYASTTGNSDDDMNHIHFSKDKQKIYIPIVDGKKVTNGNLVYVFDGKNFVFDKNAK